MTDDTIYRRAAIEAIKELCEHYTPTKSVTHPHMDFMIEELQNLPSAQPEIIRCKDCKHRNRYRFPPQYEERDYCEKHEKVVCVADFCSWAERRTDEADYRKE